jgi:hypothetical protein
MLPKLLWSVVITLIVVLASLVGGMWENRDCPPEVDAGDLAMDPEQWLGRDVIIMGKWLNSGPCERSYMIVEVRGRNGRRVVCHFEDVPETERSVLETRLLRTGDVAVRGRCDGVENGHAVLRGCSVHD